MRKSIITNYARRMVNHLSYVVVSLLGSGIMVWSTAGYAYTTQQERPFPLQKVGFDQRLNAQIPLDLDFRDETGTVVPLGKYFGEKPVILVPAYYQCPMLCTLVNEGLIRSLRALPFDAGNQFSVLTVSFDPTDRPESAAKKKEQSLQLYNRPGAAKGWHFLTGDAPSIQRLMQTIGFRYTPLPEKEEYAHATGIVLLTPEGKIARYFYGIEYAPRDLKFGLMEAAANRIGSPIDQVLLFCYQYDPATGRYSVTIMKVLRLAGLLTVLAVGSFVFVMIRSERSKRRRDKEVS